MRGYYSIMTQLLRIYRIRQNFRGGKLSRLCTKHTIHWKTFAVHQAHAIMYCTQQMIQGENFHDWLKNCENRESFPPQKFCRIRYIVVYYIFCSFIGHILLGMHEIKNEMDWTHNDFINYRILPLFIVFLLSTYICIALN